MHTEKARWGRTIRKDRYSEDGFAHGGLIEKLLICLVVFVGLRTLILLKFAREYLPHREAYMALPFMHTHPI